MDSITHTDIRMYRTGTGDCFVLKFQDKNANAFTMMIDGGTWSGSKSKLKKYVINLKKFVNNKVDILVITHEHKDHVHLFDACSDLFTSDFEVGEVWMAWTEDKCNNLANEWKEKFGQKKRALALASKKISAAFSDPSFSEGLENESNFNEMKNGFSYFSESLDEFRDLHLAVDSNREYKGGLKGMEIVKNEISKSTIRYFRPGDIESITTLPRIKFYMLGPPEKIRAVKKEHGTKHGDTYDHNKVLKRSDSFAAAISNDTSEGFEASPFLPKYFKTDVAQHYNDENQKWRQIDYDWLVSGAGNLALRLNSGINNLSLAMAIEFEESGKVMLFPGDAEFGSWESWHNIEWERRGESGKHLTEDLLNRTVFYKVAHHLSHNGTAKDKGLAMMKSNDLVAMATLDFDVISNNWKSTMPNRGILKDLIKQTRGRLIIMNEKGLYYDFDGKEPLKEKISNQRSKLSREESQSFDKSFKETALYKQFRLEV